MGRRVKAFDQFLASVRGDFAAVQRYRQKYHGETISTARLPADLVRKVGFQMMFAMRGMGLLRDAGLPVLPQIASRMIRHLYGAEVHWNTELDPGVAVVHGTGLVLSHRAHVSAGCILFHNVTLGEGIDPVTRESGAPYLEEDVHVGPGATLIGPIRVGKGTKIAAGAVLMKSVPPNSLVTAPEASVSVRKKP